MAKASSQLFHQVRKMLEKSHLPAVTVRQSGISGAGRGVFLNKSKVQRGEALCLYPGIYTPGLPTSASQCSSGHASEYLGKGRPPSKVPFEENAYIINASDENSGYFDGCALKLSEERSLDENPSCCAHLVNHSPNANVVATSFLWKQVIVDDEIWIGTSGLGGDKNSSHFSLPNVIRHDGSHRYLDGLTNELVCFPLTRAQALPLEKSYLCGIAFQAVHNIKEGDEICLDYALKPPYPKWATWYNDEIED